MPAGMIALLALGMFGRYGSVLYQVCHNIKSEYSHLVNVFRDNKSNETYFVIIELPICHQPSCLNEYCEYQRM